MARNTNTGLYVAHMIKHGMPEHLTEDTIKKGFSGVTPDDAPCFASISYEGPNGELNREYYILAGEGNYRRWYLEAWIYDREKESGFLHRSTLESFADDEAEWEIYTPGTTLAQAIQSVAEQWLVSVRKGDE